MNILVICQYYYPEPVRITDICEEFVKMGNNVTVLTGIPNYPMGDFYDGYSIKKRREENINGVKKVVPQTTLDYTENLKKFKPDYVFYGDDWKEGIQSQIRQNVINTLEEWGGQLIEIPFTEDVSIDQINNIIKNASSIPDARRGKLKQLISLKLQVLMDVV